ncbi:glycosyltransferase [Fusibacter sp. JL216-2]|uniref:glycosyltransferase n=1 Tax=Fusibacter sp. JL216-2 TaxID=3071453 RepID=UPI003D32DC2E
MGLSPLVSVAIITYNQKQYLKECIESILVQDYSHIEIVVADDGSTDGTHEMLKAYDMKYPGKFKLVLSNYNQGITINSNNALHECQGKYIAWIGGDDIFLPQKISLQVKYMEEHDEVVLSYHNIDTFDSTTGKTLYYYNDKNGKHEGSVDLIVEYGTFMGACSVMVRSEACPKYFDDEIPVASDWLFWIETCYNGKVAYIDEVLSRYRKHNRNISLLTNENDAFQERLKTLSKVDTRKLVDPISLNKAYARVYYAYSLKMILRGKKGCKESIKKSIEFGYIDFRQRVLSLVCRYNLGWILRGYYKYLRKLK